MYSSSVDSLNSFNPVHHDSRSIALHNDYARRVCFYKMNNIPT